METIAGDEHERQVEEVRAAAKRAQQQAADAGKRLAVCQQHLLFWQGSAQEAEGLVEEVRHYACVIQEFSAPFSG